MNPTRRSARMAGLLYLILAATIMFGFTVRKSLLVPGDAAATAANIVASETLFRIATVSQLLGQVAFVFLGLALYRLFEQVDKTQAAILLALVVVAVPIAFLNMLNQVAALELLSGADFLQALGAEQRNSLALLFLHLFQQGVYVVKIFWGLWLFPFGLLVVRCGFIPRMLGVFLMIGCFGYLVESFTFLAFPAYGEAVSPFAIATSAVAEVLVLLWLLIIGAKESSPARAATG